MNEIVNFELVSIFDEALVSSVIINMTKDKPKETFQYLEFNNEEINDEIFENKKKKGFNIINNSLLLNDFWLFSKIEEQEIILKINKQGELLKNFDSIQIKRGITTGFDNAFIIEENSDIYNSSLAKNFLRGRDINRYNISKNALKLLFVPWHYPLHQDSSISGASTLAENTFEDTYSKEYQHLYSFKKELSSRNKSETGKRYEWYALQRYAASYYQLFENEKIVWGLISGGWDFALDKNKNLLTSSSFFLTTNDIPIKLILSLFNSNLYKFYFSIIGEKTAGGAFVFKKTTIEKFIIPNNSNYNEELIDVVDKILSIKQENPKADTTILEKEIDQMVYELYGLTAEEIAIVENS